MPSKRFLFRAINSALMGGMCIVTLHLARAQPGPMHSRIYTEQQLFELGEAAYEKGDFPYAAMHLHAYMQKSPQALRNNGVLAQQVVNAWYYSAQQMETMAKQAKQLPQCQARLASAQGQPASFSQGLGAARPSVEWSRVKQEAGYR